MNKKVVIGLMVWLAFWVGASAGDAQEKPEIFVQLGHSEYVNSVAFSPDGRYALSGSSDDTLKLWEVATGREIRTFEGHSDSVRSVAFSPDGRYALSGSSDYTLKLWEVATGNEIRTFEGHSNSVESVAFSPDGRYALSGSYDKTLKLWEVATGNEIRTFEGHSDKVNSVAFSPDGKYALSGSDDKTLKLWGVATGREIRTFEGHSWGVNPVAFSRDGRYALSGSIRTLRLWEVATGNEIRTFGGRSWGVQSVAFSPDSRYALSGSDDKTLRLWEVATGNEIRTFGGHSWGVNSVAFSRDGRYALSGGFNIMLWEVATGREIRTFEGHPFEVESVAFSRDGRYALSGSSDFTLKLWEVATGNEIRTFEGHSGSVRSVAFSPDGRYALSGSWDKTLKLWEVATGREIRTFKGHPNEVDSVAFSPDGRYALSGGRHTLKLWEVATGREIRTFKGHPNEVNSVAFSPDGRYALSGGFNTLRLWDVATGGRIRTFEGHSGRVNSVAFSPDSRYVLSGGGDKTLKLWEVATGREIRTFEGHSFYVRSVTFSPDGRYALSGSADSTMRLWDINTGKEIVQMVTFRDGNWICITPEGYFNASPEGAKYLNVRIGNKVYAIDQFFEKFYNPAVVAQVLSGQKITLADDIKKGFKTPPEVAITSPRPNEVFDKEEIEIVVQAKDTGGGIDEIRLYHNGSVVGEARRGIKIVKATPSLIKKAYRVILVDGENIFRAVGFSEDRTQSNPYELIVKLTAPKKSVSLHLFVVGINRYKNSDLNLNFAEPDARAIEEFFARKGKTLFKDVKTTEFYNEDATKENILSKLDALQTDPQDVVIIYLAGHGISIKDNWYFIPHDVIHPEEDPEVMEKGISSLELADKIRNIQALKKLVLIDACKSGTILLAFARGLEERRALAQLARATGIHVMAASTKDQYASEVKDLGHGVFTYTLLEGLDGKARLVGNKVTVCGLLTYVDNRLPEVSKKYRREAQFPVRDSRGMDFPLVLVK